MLLRNAASFFVFLSCLMAYASARATTPIVRASDAGARLDTNLLTGGGTDDTLPLQRVLDRAAGGKIVHLILDGAALVSGLNIYGNTTIECSAGAGLYLKDNSSRAILRNANRSRGEVRDEHIVIRGCFLNGNRQHQPSASSTRPDLPALDSGPSGPSNKEPDGTYLSGLQFLGVNYLTLDDVTLWNVRAFGALIGNADRVAIRNVTIDHGGPPDASPKDYGNTDGLHFKGPLRNVNIDGVKLRVGDDALAFNANDYETDDLTVRNDFGPYVGQGPITDVTVSNVQLMNSFYGIRILSSRERIDRVVISNVTGIVTGGYVVNISHWMNPTSLGNVGSISIENVQVDRRDWDAETLAAFATRLRKLKILAKDDKTQLAAARLKEWNEYVFPFVSVNARVEHLLLRNIATSVSDHRPILRIGPDAQVRLLNAELSLQDVALKGVPVELDEGSNVDRMDLKVSWNGAAADQSRNAIVNLGGTVGQLQWVGTPPMYVDAKLNDQTVTVMFSQSVKAADFKAGVQIKINGEPAAVVRVVHESSRPDVVHYVLGPAVRHGAAVTWAYDVSEGSIQNLNGGQLLSVVEKRVTEYSGE